MKSRISHLLVSLILVVIPISAKYSDSGIKRDTSRYDYRANWRSVYLLEQEEKPRSVLEKVNEIYRQARIDSKVPHEILALMTSMKWHERLNTGSLYSDIERLEKRIKEVGTSNADKAILHSILGEVYRQNARHGKRGNAELKERPSELREWSRINYYERAFEHLTASVRCVENEQEIQSTTYYPIVQKGYWSNFYSHSLTHFICKRAIDELMKMQSLLNNHKQSDWETFPLRFKAFQGILITPQSNYDVTATVMQIYQRLQTHYAKKGTNNDKWLLLELNRLNDIPYEAQANIDERITYLEELKQAHAENVNCAEVYWAKANVYGYKNDNINKLKELEEAVKRYPDYPIRNTMLNMIEHIKLPKLQFYCYKNIFYPGQKIYLNIHYRNLKEAILRLHRIDLPADSISIHHLNTDYLKRHAHFYDELKISLTPTNNYIECEEQHSITAPSVGNYLLEVVANNIASKEMQLFSVNSLTLIGQQLPDSGLCVSVLDSRTGHPIEGAYVEEAEQKNKDQYLNVHRYRTNNRGEVILPTKKAKRILRAETANDKTMLFNERYFNLNFDSGLQGEKTKTQLLLMTDRTLFRPGQDVYVKGTAYSEREQERHVWKSGIPFIVRLCYGNKTLSEKRIKSNEFGSFSTVFTLPKEASGKLYTIQAFQESDEEYKKKIFIHVEEYKRPTFEVTLDSISQKYEAGDTVCVSGTARSYVGIPITHATIKYNATLTRNMILRHDIISRYESDKQHGESITDEEGRFFFHVVIPSLKEDEKSIRYWNDYMHISVDVLSQTGEQQSTFTELRSSNIPYKVNIQCDKTLLEVGSSCEITIGVTNLSDFPIEAETICEIYRKENIPTNGKQTIEEHLIYKGITSANKKYTHLLPDTLPAGDYRIHAFLIHKGDTISNSSNIRLYSLSATRPSGTKSTNELLTIKQSFSPGNPACIQWETHEQNVYVHYQIYTKKGILESRNFIASDTTITFFIDSKPEYRNGVGIQICYQKDGYFHRQLTSLHPLLEEKRLELKWHTFRNRLHPGTTEEWILNITTPDGTPAHAELLASMYDDALNLFPTMHKWILPYASFPNLYYNPWRQEVIDNRSRRIDITVPFEYIKKDVPKQWRYDMFLNRMFPWSDRKIDLVGSVNTSKARGSSEATASNMLTFKAQDSESNSVINDALEEEVIISYGESKKEENLYPKHVDKNNLYNQSVNTLRKNFNETAFFLPHLQTDKRGNVNIKFTLPEDLTRWKFKAFAHTKDMIYGTLNDIVTAEKAFTVQPYLPRFVRTNDLTTVKAQITNLTNNSIGGTVRMELFDPETERIICQKKASFAIKARKSFIVSFEFKIKESESCSLPACRIIAEGNGFSDGEQRYLPLLDNRTEVTEAIPLFIKDGENLTQSLETLFNKASSSSRDYRLTIEATGTPTWLAIQALPTIASPDKGNAIDYATAYYAQTLGAFLINKYPNISTQIKKWAQTDKSSLWSELQKDHELKNILLEETPWLTEANNEADQRKRIITFFNTSSISQQRIKCLQQLRDCINGDGWGWYNGMSYNRFVTSTVLLLINRVQALTGYRIEELDAELATSIKRIETVINKEIEEELKRTQKEKRLYTPSETTIDYLYSRSLTGNPINNELLTASLIALLPQSNLYERARIACILYHEGKKEEAEKYVQSLIEYSVCTPHLGRYYDSHQISYGWRNYRIATHTAAMEAIRLIMPEEVEVLNEMRQWLIAQKQVQAWNTSVNTVDAVFALLCDNSLVPSEQQPFDIFLDGEVVKDTTNSPLNYLKLYYNENKLKKLPKEIRIVKKEKGFAYGAVYAQYTEKLTKMTTSTKETNADAGITTPLAIERQILVKRIVNEKEVWDKVTEKTLLRVGDEIMVRLVVTADRDMTFIQIKDGRLSCCEPTQEFRNIRFANGICYHQTIKDASTLFFIDHLPKGTHLIEHRMHIERAGIYQAGLATIQSAYAPEFVAHTKGLTMQVAEK